MSRIFRNILCSVLCFFSFALFADDEECRKLCRESEEILLKGNANEAGELALKASKSASDPVLKANALHLPKLLARY